MVENEKLYTENDIMKILMHMTPENRIALLSMGFETLINIANNSESAQCALDNCDKYIEAWQRAKESITEFMEKQQEQTTENVIEDMVGIYKDLSREERLEFSKKLQDEENIINSLDMLKYSWGKLVNKFILLE